jgi:transcription initiation factor TFIID subunit 3
VNWVKYSNSFAVSRKLNELPTSLITNLIEKRKLDLNDGETDQEKKKRKYKERQEFYNQLKLNDGNDYQDHNQDEDDDDMVTDNDKLKWLNYLIEKDLKLGHNLKFLNTSLQCEYEKFNTNPKFHPQAKNNDKPDQQYNKNDHIVLNIEVENDEEYEVIRPSQKLVDSLPYNVKYDEYLLQDIEPSDTSDEPHNDDIIPQETGFEVNDEGIGGDNNLMFL